MSETRLNISSQFKWTPLIEAEQFIWRTFPPPSEVHHEETGNSKAIDFAGKLLFGACKLPGHQKNIYHL